VSLGIPICAWGTRWGTLTVVGYVGVR